MRTRQGCAGATLVAAALAWGACGGGSDGPVLDAAAVERSVLEASDAGVGFRVVERGPQRMADAPPAPRADPARFGRTGGWKARFARTGDSTTRGPLVVAVLVDRFRTPDGARRDFTALAGQVRGERRAAPDLGAEARLGAASQPAFGGRVRSYTVAWRFGNVTASVTADGFRLREADVLALARRQQEKLAAAAADG